MVTQYDMLTGQVIGDRSPDAGLQPVLGKEPLPALRLVSCDEAAATGPQRYSPSPAVLMLPLAVLLNGGSPPPGAR